MRLKSIRDVAFPGVRAFRTSLVSIVTMAAVIVGLLAMHAAGAEHLDAPVAAAAAAQHAHAAPHAQTGEAMTGPVLAAASVVSIAASSVTDCGENCMQNALTCMIMIMTCAMLVVLAIVSMLANRPAVYKQLLDAGGRVASAVRNVSLLFLRPDLTLLSISRT